MLIGKERIEEFLNNEGITDYIESPKNGIKKKFSFNSPFCNDSEKKCVMWFNSGKYRCYKSGEEGSFFKFVKYIKNYSSLSEAKMYFLKNYWKNNLADFFKDSLTESTDLNEEISYIEFPDYFKEFNIETDIEYFNYLKNRIKLETLKQIKLFINPKEKRIIFPFYNESNQLIYYTGRSIIPDNKLRWKDASVKNKNELFYSWNTSQIIYLTEGIFDALKINGGTAVLGAYLSEKARKKILSKNPYRIIIVFDNDLTGKEAQIRTAAEFTEEGYKNLYLWNWKHSDIIKYKDFGEIPYSILDKSFNYFYKFDFSGFLKWKLLNLNDFETEQKEKIKRILKNIKL